MNEHPSIADIPYDRWRDIKTGGDVFVENYLVARPKEDPTDFQLRKDVTPDPATASSAIDDVINSFAARMDVTRTGGSKEYNDVIAGKSGGVDKNGTSIQNFILSDTLGELCYMGKVGWLVQNFTDPNDPRKVPFIIRYRAEDIVNWYPEKPPYSSVALRDYAYVLDDNGFQGEATEVFRVFRKVEGKVITHIENAAGARLDPITLQESPGLEETLSITEIPVIIGELPRQLLRIIDKYQITVLNMESADIEWLRTGNITLYVEEAAGLPGMGFTQSTDPENEEDKNVIVLGSTRGRTYSPGHQAPSFIAPPAEPIKVSMEKQLALKIEAREILKTRISEMKLASAETVAMLGEGLEAGLFIIGVTLMNMEIQFASIFHAYQNRGDQEVSIAYPKKYELRTEEARIEKVKSLKAIQRLLGTNIAKKAIEIQITEVLLEGKMPYEDYSKILQEVKDSTFCIYDPDTLVSLVEQGIISRALASVAVGAPDGDSETAQEEHIKRIQAVKISQTSGLGDVNPDNTFVEKVKKEDATNVSA